MPRIATRDDAGDLARLINEAFIVEAFFKIGDRTSPDEIAALIEAGGEFLVLDEPGTGTPIACVYLKYGEGRAYLGMLSVAAAKQRQGLGMQLIEAAEGRARERGCRVMDIHIVNLRQELLPYYRRAGYVENDALPFSEPERASRACHFIVMSKPL